VTTAIPVVVSAVSDMSPGGTFAASDTCPDTIGLFGPNVTADEVAKTCAIVPGVLFVPNAKYIVAVALVFSILTPRRSVLVAQTATPTALVVTVKVDVIPNVATAMKELLP
jgi:hypothetical protein